MAVVAKVAPDVVAFLSSVSEADSDALATALHVGRTDRDRADVARKELARVGVSASFSSALERGLTQVWRDTLPALSERHDGEQVGRDGMYLRALVAFTSRAIKRRAVLSEESFAIVTEPFRAAGYDFDAPHTAAEQGV